MKAVVFDQTLRFVSDHPAPTPKPGWALIQPQLIGICRTDLELVQGYMGFSGVLGHEFVGTVLETYYPSFIGQRVVGEINAVCGHCSWCVDGLGRHCENRTVLGILALDGCMAQRCTLPQANLHIVPETISDNQAVFVEPLSAAFEITEQLSFNGSETCVVLGDGKLGILCAWALSTVLENVTLVGHHQRKLKLAQWGNITTSRGVDSLPTGADIVVEATGSPSGLTQAIDLCRPRGTIVLKSTIATQGKIDLAPVVVKEQSIIGSRCGPFARGLDELVKHRFPVERLIDARYALDDAKVAFEHAGQPNALKVVLE